MISFYLDSHIAKAVAIQLRAKGITATHCQEVGLADASDIEHLEYATDNELIAVTQDADFIELHTEWQRINREHEGIMFVPPNLRGEGQISYVVRKLTEYYTLIVEGAGTPDELKNIITYL